MRVRGTLRPFTREELQEAVKHKGWIVVEEEWKEGRLGLTLKRADGTFVEHLYYDPEHRGAGKKVYAPIYPPFDAPDDDEFVGVMVEIGMLREEGPVVWLNNPFRGRGGC